MRVLGIDPGTAVTGYGLVGRRGEQLHLVRCGAISTAAALPFPARLKLIFDGLRQVIAELEPDCAAIEGVFFARNVQSAIKLGQARGAALLAAVSGGLPVFEYSPLEVKGAVTGYGRAEKGQVQEMVRALLRLAEAPHPPDAADALAVAICHHHAAHLRQRIPSR